MGNSYGKIFKLTTFGESHGGSIGGIIDGCPSGVKIDLVFIQDQLDRRRPGQSKVVSERNELDKVEILSGIFNGVSTGTPIGFIIKNNDQRAKDYSNLEQAFRPSHADFTYSKKYGNRDFRGGGRSSARETACRVVAGSVAQLILNKIGVEIFAYVSSVGSLRLNKSYNNLDLNSIDDNIVRCPDVDLSKSMIKLIEDIKKSGDTIGGVISCVAKGLPIGIGEPVFDKLHAEIGKGMLSINAVKAFKLGFENQDISSSLGSQVNDIIIDKTGKTKTNFSGGIQGGISNGNDIYCEISFKPVSTLMINQESINLNGDKIILKAKGRHDSCVVPRAVPIVEAMMALTILDHYLISKSNNI
jgi:chorismate synthase|tara:strand:- start:17916 stop:18989 length:1074 start_codon:yes stop_codon:yes gene_type:complete